MDDTKKRRQYLINKQFQIKFIIKVYLAVFITIATVGLFLFYLNDKTLSHSAYQQVLNMRSARDMLLPTILSISAITAIVALVIIIFKVILESHKIAGPIYRFEKAFETVGYGDLTASVKLRKKDEMQDLSEKFNAMLSCLNSNIVKSKKTVKKLREVTALKDEENKEILNLINELEENLSKIKTTEY